MFVPWRHYSICERATSSARPRTNGIMLSLVNVIWQSSSFKSKHDEEPPCGSWSEPLCLDCLTGRCAHRRDFFPLGSLRTIGNRELRQIRRGIELDSEVIAQASAHFVIGAEDALLATSLARDDQTPVGHGDAAIPCCLATDPAFGEAGLW